jgi:3-hydroxybutyryl-CoA dehydrogenase
MAEARRLGKSPIVVRRDAPGFVGNRLQFAVMREALHILSEGIASAQDIDTAMKTGPGLRYGILGPLETADLGGLDVFLAITRYLLPELNSKTSPPAVLQELVEHGKLGAKSGEGFYTYGGSVLADKLSARDRLLLRFLDALENEGKSR